MKPGDNLQPEGDFLKHTPDKWAPGEQCQELSVKNEEINKHNDDISESDYSFVTVADLQDIQYYFNCTCLPLSFNFNIYTANSYMLSSTFDLPLTTFNIQHANFNLKGTLH